MSVNGSMQTRFNAIVVASLSIGLIVGYALAVFQTRTIAKQAPNQVLTMSSSSHDMMTMGSMMGDMTAGLKGKTGNDFDHAFLTEMIVHHQGAVDMARLVLAQSTRPELKAFANKIITAQSAEITQMRAWQTAWSATTTKEMSEGEQAEQIIRQFASNSVIGKTYRSIQLVGKAPNQKDELVSKYDADGDSYLLSDASKITEFSRKELDQPEATILSNKLYPVDQLEEIAKKLIPADINLSQLIPSHSNKLGTNYFFHWEDRSQSKIDSQRYPYIEVAIHSDGTIYHYVNVLQ